MAAAGWERGASFFFLVAAAGWERGASFFFLVAAAGWERGASFFFLVAAGALLPRTRAVTDLVGRAFSARPRFCTVVCVRLGRVAAVRADAPRTVRGRGLTFLRCFGLAPVEEERLLGRGMMGDSRLVRYGVLRRERPRVVGFLRFRYHRSCIEGTQKQKTD